MQILNTVAQRNKIASASRYEGLQVQVLDNGITYELIGGTTDGYWTPVAYRLESSGGDFYVDEAGDDDNDGSIGSPVRQPQAIINRIDPNASGVYYRIHCGSGTFNCPDISNVPPNVRVSVYGNRSNPIVENASPPSFSQISGKNAQWEGALGSHSGIPSDGYAWLFADWEEAFGLGQSNIGAVVRTSVSPSINAILRSGFIGAPASVYPYETIFQVPHLRSIRFKGIMSWATLNTENTSDLGSAFIFYGIRFELLGTPFNAHSSFWKNVRLLGCHFTTDDATNNGIVNMVSCENSSYYEELIIVICLSYGKGTRGFGSENISENRISGALFKSELFVSGYVNALSAVFAANSSAGIEAQCILGEEGGMGAQLTISSDNGAGVDFEGNLPCFLCSGGLINQNGPISIANSPSYFIGNQDIGLRAYSRSQGTIDGTVTGDAITLINGAQAVGISAAADGNLTSSSGGEIVVGNGAPNNAFSDLPITDATTLCRAT